MKNQLACFSKRHSEFTSESGIPEAKNGDEVHLIKHIIRTGVDSTVAFLCVGALAEKDKREKDLECEDFLFTHFQT